MQKARKIYETLTTEIAPGHLKSILAFIGFEKRMNNNEKAKDLFFKAFTSVLNLKNAHGVTYIVMQYARFLVYKYNDV